MLFLPGLMQAQQRLADDAFERGLEYHTERNYDSALAYFNKTIHLSPLTYVAYKYRAECRTMKNNLEGALLDYRLYLDQFPNDVDALFAYSEINYREEHYDEALEGFLKLKSLPAGSTSRIYYRIRPGETGVSGMFTAQTRDKSYLYNYLGLTYAGLGDYSRSILYFDSALVIKPYEPDYITNKGITHQQAGYHDLAKDEFRRALEIDPGHALARQELANLIRNEGNQEEAIELYSEDISTNPNSPVGYANRGYAHLLKGDNRRAIEDFDAAIRRNPKEPSSWLNRGIALLRVDLLEEAFSDFSMAIKLDPTLASAYMNRGNVLYRLGEYADALNDYDVAIIYDKTYFLAYYHRGITQYQLGDKEGACASLRFAAVNGIDIAGKTLRQICP